MAEVLTVLIADDHQLMLAGVRQVLELDDSFEIVAEASHGTQILPLVAQTQPEVVLLDMRMPGIDGLSCLDWLRARYPDVHVVMCSVAADPESAGAAEAPASPEEYPPPAAAVPAPACPARFWLWTLRAARWAALPPQAAEVSNPAVRRTKRRRDAMQLTSLAPQRR